MAETERIADQLRRSYEGDAWHGPALKEVLEGISAERALSRPIHAAHTIWDIVLHVSTWASLAQRAIEGEPIPTWPFPEDWPPIAATNEAAWRAAKDKLWEIQDSLADTIIGLQDDRLNETVPGRPYNFYHLLHGIVQHNLYHAGQIAILRK